MATKKTTTNTKKKTTAKSNTENVNMTAKVTTTTEETITNSSTPIVAKAIDPHTMISVINNTRGTLIYVSPRTKEEFVWRSFGDAVCMEYGELLAMKSSAKRFFTENWVMIEEYGVLTSLGVDNYYKNIPTPDKFDEIFELSTSELQSKVGAMSRGMKNSIALRARELITLGELDSRKTIQTLEAVLGVELTDDYS